MQKTCSKCQQIFGCKNEAPGCWCESVSLTTGTLVHLKENFENCLCPSCLKEYSMSSTSPEKEEHVTGRHHQ